MTALIGRGLISVRFAAALGLAAAAALASPPRAAFAADWPQAHSDLRADPRVLFGALPNGMRYAIMRNETPKGAVSMWLNVNDGSLQENDAQQGLAHFLEHMAFRGSKNVPENEVWPSLQRLGLAIGADANASTGFTQTLYKFNFPRNDTESIDGGLLRLRDIAGALTLSQAAMDAERGVILSEERLRDTPDYRAGKKRLAFLFPHSRLNERFPIGSTDIIKHAPVSLIRDFYNAYYRPERSTVIVVGDIDAKAMEAKIVKVFSDWKPSGPAGAEPAPADVNRRGAEAALYAEAGVAPSLSLTWVLKTEPDSVARERNDLTRLLALSILSDRLNTLASGPQSPFVAARSNFAPLDGATTWSVAAAIRPQAWHAALDGAVRELRRMTEFGVTADEFARAKDRLHALFQQAAATAATDSNNANAAQIASDVAINDVFVGPADTLALIDQAFNSLSLDGMNAAIRTLMGDGGPLVFLSSPAPVDGGEAAVAAALTAAEKAPLTRPVEQAKVTWPYTDFGPAGKVVERKSIADLDTTALRFANGVRLAVKPTTFKAGEVGVNVRIGDGYADLPAGRASPTWIVDGQRLLLLGTKALSFDDISRALAGNFIQLKSQFAADGVTLQGHGPPSELATLMQVLTAYVSAPGWRADGIERARADETSDLESLTSSPMGVLQRDIRCSLVSGDPRLCSPSLADVARTGPDAIKALLAPTLASAPIEVTIVGDVKLDDAVAAVAKTFGALPARANETAIKTIALQFPAGNAKPAELHHEGRADQGFAVVAWPATDAFDLKNYNALRLLKSILGTRMMDQLRIQDGVTYSPASILSGSTVAPGYGILLVGTELPPAKMPVFFKTIGDIAADLQTHPISADELERARKPLIESLIATRRTNDYWLGALTGTQQDPRQLEIIRDTLPILTKVSARDIQAAAETYLSAAKAWKLAITPAIKSGPASATSH